MSGREGFVLPRVIYGNRGDLASRWALLRALDQRGVRDVSVFRDKPSDVPSLAYPQLDYGPIRNLLSNETARAALQHARVVLWAVGLDMQDDSSLAKLTYLNLLFRRYRRMGLQVWCVFQGAGPISTPAGRWMTRRLLENVDRFIARDPGSYRLICTLTDPAKCELGHDAIFLPGLEADLHNGQLDMPSAALHSSDRPTIGLNIRQWYHFSSSLIPYQFAQRRYRKRSFEQMVHLEASALELVRRLRADFDARVVLLSAYQPDVVNWEDDLFWLQRLKDAVRDDEVVLADKPLSMPEYFRLMAGLDLMIGMRLHSTLIALRFGVPGINLSYTLKGRDIMEHLGLGDWVEDLEAFVTSSDSVFSTASTILSDRQTHRYKTLTAVNRAIEDNLAFMNQLFGVR